jgi:hypothetical protein
MRRSASRFVHLRWYRKGCPKTLSRWRHGFEPRWDYKREPAGQRHGAVAADALNGYSNPGYPANIPHESCVTSARSSARIAGGYTSSYGQLVPIDLLRCSCQFSGSRQGFDTEMFAPRVTVSPLVGLGALGMSLDELPYVPSCEPNQPLEGLNPFAHLWRCARGVPTGARRGYPFSVDSRA